ncbi:MAG TPA: hypothetical protein VFC46_16475, partial [Humisphaera sp.]|nr:hypothetical protein [Humisphaera sp.]
TPVLLGLGAFMLQFAVQGAWGVIPAHLNELSPDEIRGTFPGFAYQIGNLLASSNAVIQTRFAASHGGNYAIVMAVIASVMAVALIALTARGPEAREIVLGGPPA